MCSCAETPRVSLQFGGSDILICPPPQAVSFRAQRMARKRRPASKLIYIREEAPFLHRAHYAGRVGLPGESSLSRKWKCIRLSICRLSDSPQLATILDEILRAAGAARLIVRPYREFLRMLGTGGLSYAWVSMVGVGGGYLIRADGRGVEPRHACGSQE